MSIIMLLIAAGVIGVLALLVVLVLLFGVRRGPRDD
jgi:ABC-type lipoprotein release transport system permease subunit